MNAVNGRIPDPAANGAQAPTGGKLAIGVDIGGTKVLAGLVNQRGEVIARARRPTPSRDPRAVERTIAEVVKELSAGAESGREISGVGIGAAGFVDADRARVLFAPHLAWRNEPLRDA